MTKELVGKEGADFPLIRVSTVSPSFSIAIVERDGAGQSMMVRMKTTRKAKKNTEIIVYRPTSGEINGAINGVINGAINEDITISKNEKAILENIIENPRITK